MPFKSLTALHKAIHPDSNTVFELGMAVHQFQPVGKRPDGAFTRFLSDAKDTVAACCCGWQGEVEWTPTGPGPAGVTGMAENALIEWQEEHVRPLVLRVALRTGHDRASDTLEKFMEDEAALPWDEETDPTSDLVMITMLEALLFKAVDRMQARVTDALAKKASWRQIADAVGMTEDGARARFGFEREQNT